MKAPQDQQASSTPTSPGGGYLGAMEKLRENVAPADGASGRGAGDDLSKQLEQVTESRRATRKLPWEPYLEMGLGLRNYWYPACFSNELEEGKVRGEEIGGERILFKRIDGTVYGVQDRCIHRGVAFSARPECHTKNTLTCWFHGFTYDVRDGKLVSVLSQPDSQIVGKVSLPTYHVHESMSIIWVYIGDGEPVPFVEDLPPTLQRAYRGEERRAFHPLVRVRIPSDWRLAMENGFDPGHVYGHRDAAIGAPCLAYYYDRNNIEFVEKEGQAKGMIPHVVNATFVQEAWVEDVKVTVEPRHPSFNPPGDDGIAAPGDSPDNSAPWLPCLNEAAAFPDGKQTHFEWFVPIDEGHHMYTIMQSRLVTSDEEEAAFHAECERVWGPFVWSTDPELVGFNNFDAFGRAEVMHAYAHEDWWHREYYYKPDFILTEWRKFVVKHARGVQKRTDMARRPPTEASIVVYNDNEFSQRKKCEFGD
ncbi:Rieske 2Fe-2S domain-containing protein [Burkholderia multivorans]|uniref:Rieske 2Fe-2S domain-containing protein n=1 Tax=Burkholderia multivorans TaxID=87883 RepID=UPI0021BF778F|nr:Rieske 2Fe-2S domain-containing protein [Burkholderia multivorans]